MGSTAKTWSLSFFSLVLQAQKGNQFSQEDYKEIRKELLSKKRDEQREKQKERQARFLEKKRKKEEQEEAQRQEGLAYIREVVERGDVAKYCLSPSSLSPEISLSQERDAKRRRTDTSSSCEVPQESFVDERTQSTSPVRETSSLSGYPASDSRQDNSESLQEKELPVHALIVEEAKSQPTDDSIRCQSLTENTRPSKGVTAEAEGTDERGSGNQTPQEGSLPANDSLLSHLHPSTRPYSGVKNKHQLSSTCHYGNRDAHEQGFSHFEKSLPSFQELLKSVNQTRSIGSK
eukprot:TRINITY_DN3176_c0_g1_i3.p1 TRINITY_DN3176_c0_g1~~TRINITY_DN3176_c0_g1_i3.p1  ORF type:complete len:290 (+),score=63.59 TRINITY_DN3176_c0_g1_i3:110-979(+)